MTDHNETAASQTTPPSASFLRRLEISTIDKASELLSIPEKPRSAKLAKLTREQEEKLQEIEDAAIARFTGDLTVLEAALGMLRIGHHFGWKVLYMLHSKKTIRNYEEILDIEVRKLFDDTGPSSYRSFGFTLAQKFSNFWKVAGGDIKIPRRRDAAD